MLERNKAYSYSAALNDLLAKNIGRASSMHPASGGEASGVAGNQGEDSRWVSLSRRYNTCCRGVPPRIMLKRVTIMIDDEVDRMVREHQAGMAPLKRNRAYSYPAAVNDLLARGL